MSGQRGYDNVVTETKCFLRRKLSWERQKERTVMLGIADREIGDNSVTTTKYNLANCVPLLLYEQFSKLANVYFLVDQCD
jgi:hypothetical protein